MEKIALNSEGKCNEVECRIMILGKSYVERDFCVLLSEALAKFSCTIFKSALVQRLPSTVLMILLEEAIARGKSKIQNHES